MLSNEAPQPTGNEPGLGRRNKLISLHIPTDRSWLLPKYAEKGRSSREPGLRLEHNNEIAQFTARVYTDAIIRNATQNLAQSHAKEEKNGVYYGSSKEIIASYESEYSQLHSFINGKNNQFAGLEDIASVLVTIKALGQILEKRRIPRFPDLDVKTELYALQVGILHEFQDLTEKLVQSTYTVEGEEESYHEAVDSSIVEELETVSRLANELRSLRLAFPENFPIPGK